jgi:hypothetical protein
MQAFLISDPDSREDWHAGVQQRTLVVEEVAVGAVESL